MSTHLDLGSGYKPKNPYSASRLYGIDIEKINKSKINNVSIAEIKQANLAFSNIPFKSNFFDSVSAYDFLEHIPRVIISNQSDTRYAFIELMNEIHRVLKDGGKFYAVTPVYPHPSTFVDPTHVNFITDKTHHYFTEPSLGASMYGFTGCFKIIRVKKIRPKYLYEPIKLDLRQKIRKLSDKFKKLESHILWELEASKN